MHRKTFIHRDIKPGNFLIGRGKNEKLVYIIDFGLSNRYINPANDAHINYKTGKKLIGTPSYASVNTLSGLEQSRRDDLESLGYLILYLLKGHLPWQGIEAATKEEKHEKVLDLKTSIPIPVLCEGVPKEIADYMNYCRDLKFTEAPCYQKLVKSFRDLMINEGIYYDYKYDWIVALEALKPKIPKIEDRGKKIANE